MTTRRAAGIAVAAAIVAIAAGCAPPPAPDQETVDREAFIARVATDRGWHDTWSLVSRSDLVFDDGFSALERIDPARPGSALGGAELAAPPPGVIAVRWIGARALLRVRAVAPSRLELRGRVDVARLFARPRLTVTVDGTERAIQLVASDGSFALAVDLAPGSPAWSDVYLTVSSVAEPWREPAELRIARIESARWQPIGAGTATGGS